MSCLSAITRYPNDKTSVIRYNPTISLSHLTTEMTEMVVKNHISHNRLEQHMTALDGMSQITLKWYASHPNAKFEMPRLGDAGFDLRCVENFSIRGVGREINPHRGVHLEPLNITKVHTGIHIEIPVGYVGMICEKSSIAGGKPQTKISTDTETGEEYQAKTKQNPYGGVAVRAGIIDSSYRGEIIVVLHNLTAREQFFDAGDKIAQLLIIPIPWVRAMEQVDSLDLLSSTERGDGGFGSTGAQ